MEDHRDLVAVKGALLTETADLGGPKGGEAERLCDGSKETLDKDLDVSRQAIGVTSKEEASAAGSAELAACSEHVGMPRGDPGSLAAKSVEASRSANTAREALHEEKSCGLVLVQEGSGGPSVTDKKPTEKPDGTLPSLRFHVTDHVRPAQLANCSSSGALEKVAHSDGVTNLTVDDVASVMAEELQEQAIVPAKDCKTLQVLENSLQVETAEGVQLPVDLFTPPVEDGFIAGRGWSMQESTRVLCLENSSDGIMHDNQTASARSSLPSERDFVPRSHDTEVKSVALEVDGFTRSRHGGDDFGSKDVGKARRDGPVGPDNDLKEAPTVHSTDHPCEDGSDLCTGESGNFITPCAKTTINYSEQVEKDTGKSGQLADFVSVSEKSVAVPLEQVIDDGAICTSRFPLSNAHCEKVAEVGGGCRVEAIGVVSSLLDRSGHLSHAYKKNCSERPGVEGHNYTPVDIDGVHGNELTSCEVVCGPSPGMVERAHVEEVEARPVPLRDQGELATDTSFHNVKRACYDNSEDSHAKTGGGRKEAVALQRQTLCEALGRDNLPQKHSPNCRDGVSHDKDRSVSVPRSSCSTDQGVVVHVKVGPNLSHGELSMLVPTTESEKCNEVESLPGCIVEDKAIGELPCVLVPSEAAGAVPSLNVESEAATQRMCGNGKDLKSAVRPNETSVGDTSAHATGSALEDALPESFGWTDLQMEKKVERGDSNQEDEDLTGRPDQNSTNGVQVAQEDTCTLLAAAVEVGSPGSFGCTASDEKEGIAHAYSNEGSRDLHEGADRSSANCVPEDDNTVSRKDASKSRERPVETVSVRNMGRRVVKENQDSDVRTLRTATDVKMVLDANCHADYEKPLKLPKIGTVEDTTTLQRAGQSAMEARTLCDCGMLAIEKVLGSNSENRGLRYLSCAAYNHKQTSLKKRKQTDTKGCSFHQWIDVPRVTDEERRETQRQKRLRLEQKYHSGPVNLGNVRTRAASKQIAPVKMPVENVTMEPSSSLEETMPLEAAGLELSSSAVDAAAHYGSTSTAFDVPGPASKQVQENGLLKKKTKTPRPKGLVLTSPTKSSLTATSPSEAVKSATTSKSVSLSSSSSAEARSKSAKAIPEKPFSKQYFDDRNNPTVDWVVSKRLAFKSLNDVVDRPFKVLSQKTKVGVSPVATDQTESRPNPKRRKLTEILKPKPKSAVKFKKQKEGRTVQTPDGGSMKAVSPQASSPVAGQLVKGKKTATTEPGSSKGTKGKRKRDSSGDVSASLPAVVQLVKGKSSVIESGSSKGSKAKRKRDSSGNVLASLPAADHLVKGKKLESTESGSSKGNKGKRKRDSSGDVSASQPAADHLVKGKKLASTESGSSKGTKGKRKRDSSGDISASLPAANQFVKEKKSAITQPASSKGSRAKRTKDSSGDVLASLPGADKVVKVDKRATTESGSSKGTKAKRKQASSDYVLASLSAADKLVKVCDGATTESGSRKGSKVRRKQATSRNVQASSVLATGQLAKVDKPATTQSGSSKSSKATRKASSSSMPESLPAAEKLVKVGKTAATKSGSGKGGKAKRTKASTEEVLDPLPAAVQPVETAATETGGCKGSKATRKKASSGEGLGSSPAAVQLVKVDKTAATQSASCNSNKAKRKKASSSNGLDMFPAADPIRVDKTAATQSGSCNSSKANRKKARSGDESAKEASGKASAKIRSDAHTDDTCSMRPSKRLKGSREDSLPKVSETCESREAVWVDVPVGNSKEAKEKRPQLLVEKARAHLRNSKVAVQHDKVRDQDHSQPLKKAHGVDISSFDASQVDVQGEKENTQGDRDEHPEERHKRNAN